MPTEKNEHLTNTKHYLLLTQSQAILAESRLKGMPPPGWTLPPQKYKPLTRVEKLAWRRKAAHLLFELLP